MYNDYQQEELTESLSSFEKALEHNENKYFEIHEFEYIIDYYLASDDVSTSRNAIEKALAIHPQSHELQRRLAQLNNLEGEHERAINVLNKSFDAFGADKDVDYYLILGESYLGIDKIDKAKWSFEKAIELSGEEYFDIVTSIAVSYQQKEYFEEVIHYLKLVEKEDSSLLFDIGMAYSNIMDYENSIIYLEKSVRNMPFSVDVWYYLAKSYQANSQYELAEEAILNTIAIEPDTILYQYDLAQIYIDQSKYLEALELYKEILSKDKQVNHSIFLSIGDISFNIGQYENARKNYEIALRLYPESAEAYHALAQIEIENENYDIAKLQVQKAISFNAKESAFFLTLGTVNQLLGDVLAAELSYKEALKIDPKQETAWHLLIDYYYYIDKPKEAKKVAFDAIQEIQASYLLFCKISASYFDLEDAEKGLLYLRKALSKDSKSIAFFLDYYPEAKDNSAIIKLIRQFQ